MVRRAGRSFKSAQLCDYCGKHGHNAAGCWEKSPCPGPGRGGWGQQGGARRGGGGRHGLGDGFTWQVMEKANRSLSTVLRDRRIPLGDAFVLLEQIAEGCHYIHTKEHVHRDLKASNILLVRHTPLIADLDTVKRMGAADSISGTWTHMAPEVAREALNHTRLLHLVPEGCTVGTLTAQPSRDVWSLGIVAYQCVTGKLPKALRGTMYDAVGQQVVSEALRQANPTDCVEQVLYTRIGMGRLLPKIGSGTAERALLLSMLNLEPTRRPSAASVAAAFRAAAAAEEESRSRHQGEEQRPI
eukprot:TRINITY_DN12376_c0_g1_i4.p1 TRINITY_DN12376_c0_g1~~TRINITY_DN12376_c0_g1_i4.p1  ORF type:complete len:299 (+),score=47.80 TRINITY_DN12376_c0_g1_i4:71-967(+)